MKQAVKDARFDYLYKINYSVWISMLIIAILHLSVIPVVCFQNSNIFLYLFTKNQAIWQSILGFLSEKTTEIHKYAFSNSFSHWQMVSFIWTFQKHSVCEVSSLMQCSRLGAISLFMRRFGLKQEKWSASSPLVLFLVQRLLKWNTILKQFKNSVMHKT